MAVANLWLLPGQRVGQLQWIADARLQLDSRSMRSGIGRLGWLPGDEVARADFVFLGGAKIRLQPRRAGRASAETEEDGDGCTRRTAAPDARQRQEEPGRRASGYRCDRHGREHNPRIVRRPGIGSRRRTGEKAQLQDGGVLCRIHALPRRGHADLPHFDIGGQK